MRKRELVKILEKENFVSLEQLARKLTVSTRTIREDIKSINQESSSFNINRLKTRGYYLVIEDMDQYRMTLEEWSKERFEGKNNRIHSIIVFLLLHNNFVTNKQLAEVFSISIGQVKKDTIKIAERLESEGLFLERKSHYGVKITGNLYDKFKLLEKYSKDLQSYIVEKIEEIITSKIESEITQCTVLICQAYQLKIDGEIAKLIQRWLEIILIYYQENSLSLEKLDMEEIIVIRNILNKFEMIKHCDSYSYLLYQLLLDYQSNRLFQQTELKTFLYILYKEVDDKFNTNFVNDIDFMRMIQLHIAFMLERKQVNDFQDNFIIKTMEREFPAIMNAAILVVKSIESKYQVVINQEEIGYLTSHMAVSYEKQNERRNRKYYRIGLVCSSGGGIAQLMSLKFTRIFPNSEIKSFTIYEKEEIMEFNPTLLFSITPLDLNINCPVIQIGEILGELDYFSIQNNLDLLTELGTLVDSNEKFIDMISSEYFSINEFKDYEQLLHFVAGKIETSMNIRGYENSILERENYVSTVYENGIAIPHPMNMNSSENIISVTLLPKPIFYKQKKIKVVFMLALKSGQVELHQYLSKKLYGLMQHRSLVSELSKCQNFQEFIKLIKIYL